MTIKVKFNNRKESIEFLRAFGMTKSVQALEEAERKDQLIREAESLHRKLYDLYQIEINKKIRDYDRLGRLGRIKGQAQERFWRRSS